MSFTATSGMGGWDRLKELSDEQRVQIEDIIMRKTGVAPENIYITTEKE